MKRMMMCFVSVLAACGGAGGGVSYPTAQERQAAVSDPLIRPIRGQMGDIKCGQSSRSVTSNPRTNWKDDNITVSFSKSRGVVGSIATRPSPKSVLVTPEGIGLGSTLDEVKRAYSKGKMSRAGWRVRESDWSWSLYIKFDTEERVRRISLLCI